MDCEEQVTAGSLLATCDTRMELLAPGSSLGGAQPWLPLALGGVTQHMAELEGGLTLR